MWCIPPEQNGEFVYAMENVLEAYQRPYDPKRPVVCMDETSKQLVKETRVPQPPRPGQPQRFDYEYERNGTASIFMFAEPLFGYRQATARAHRTKIDWALEVAQLLDTRYVDCDVVTLVMDHLNTHTKGAFYEAFEPEIARAYLRRLTFCYTPKHGSWLNMAEIEFSVLGRRVLRRRIADEETLRGEIAALEAERNQARATIDWRFSTQAARVKLHHLYPANNKVD